MWPPLSQVRLWLFRQLTDMRKSYDGLSCRRWCVMHLMLIR